MTSIIVDSNVLALYVVGRVSEDHVPRFKRTKHYSIEDFRLIVRYLGQFSNVVVTPNIATETSNLIGALSGKYRINAQLILGNCLKRWREIYVESADVVEVPEFARLGLADAAILLATRRDFEVITDDLNLYIFLLEKGLPVTKFTHLRSIKWADE